MLMEPIIVLIALLEEGGPGGTARYIVANPRGTTRASGSPSATPTGGLQPTGSRFATSTPVPTTNFNNLTPTVRPSNTPTTIPTAPPASPPDLFVSQISRAGTTYTIRICNSGGSISATHTMRVEDEDGYESTLVPGLSVPASGACSNHTVECSSFNQCGNYYFVRAYADYASNVTESNESNNYLAYDWYVNTPTPIPPTPTNTPTPTVRFQLVQNITYSGMSYPIGVDVYNGELFVGASSVYVFDANTGAYKRSFAVASGSAGDIEVVDNKVFVQDAATVRVYSLTGTLLGTLLNGSMIESVALGAREGGTQIYMHYTYYDPYDFRDFMESGSYYATSNYAYAGAFSADDFTRGITVDSTGNVYFASSYDSQQYNSIGIYRTNGALSVFATDFQGYRM